MEAKFHLCLLLIIVGTLAVQGAHLQNKLENPLFRYVERDDNRRECSFVLMTIACVVCIRFN